MAALRFSALHAHPLIKCRAASPFQYSVGVRNRILQIRCYQKNSQFWPTNRKTAGTFDSRREKTVSTIDAIFAQRSSHAAKVKQQAAIDKAVAFGSADAASFADKGRDFFPDMAELQPKATQVFKTKPVTFFDDDENDTPTARSEIADKEEVVPEPAMSTLPDDMGTYFPADAETGEAAVEGASEEEPAVHTEPLPGSHVVPAGMRRYHVVLQFHGGHFYGWDRTADVVRRLSHRPGLSASGKKQHDDIDLTATHPTSNLRLDDITKPRETIGGSELAQVSAAMSKQLGSSARPQDPFAAPMSPAAAAVVSSLMSARPVAENALAVALDVPRIRLYPACIVETGVHVRRLICHLDIPSSVVALPRTVLQRAAVWLRDKGDSAMAILAFMPCLPDPATGLVNFHARHTCTRRLYLYRILNRVAPPLFEAGQHWHVDRALDVSAMQKAAAILQGTHDFSAFADPGTLGKILARYGRSTGIATTRTLERIDVVRQEDEVMIWFIGKSFLRHQIRSIVGVLKFVGQGLWCDKDVERMLDTGRAHGDTMGFHYNEKNVSSRMLRSMLQNGDSVDVVRGSKSAKQTKTLRPPLAPAHGLTLFDTEYPHGVDASVRYTDSGALDEIQ